MALGEVVRQNIEKQDDQDNPEPGKLQTLKLNGNDIGRIGGHWLLRGLQVSASIKVIIITTVISS